jgi:hypothetical protein
MPGDLKLYEPNNRISLEIFNNFIEGIKRDHFVISEIDMKVIRDLKYNDKYDTGQREMKISYMIKPTRKEEKNMIEMNDEVKDTITDFKGTVVAKIIYATGCTRFEVKPRGLKDGKSIEAEWIDESQLKITKKAKPKVIEATKMIKDEDPPGGSGDIPDELSHP